MSKRFLNAVGVAAVCVFLTTGCASLNAVSPAATAEPMAAPALVASEPVVWDLAPLFPTLDAWIAERDALTGEIEGLAAYKGKLGKSPAALADALDAFSAFTRRAARLSVYASLKSDEDTRIEENLAREQEARQLFAQAGEATAYADPEILALGSAKIERFIAAEPRLAKHAFRLRDTLREAPHTLDERGEQLLASASLPLSGAQRVYSQLTNADIPWPTLEVDGEEVLLNAQGYVRLRQHPDREVRRQVFETFWTAYGAFESSLGQTLAANTQAQVFTAKARNYESARHAALASNQLPVAIYDQLIAQARAGLPTLHRYFQLRARMLGVDDLAYYDIYPELLSLDATYDLETSKTLTRDALAPFGPDYLAELDRGFAAEWMHAYPQEGKRSGAYVNGWAYDVSPYVLLNHQGSYDSLSTFAHEWGHAVHSALANKAQPFETADYATFVAEMASTINEVLLLRKLYAEAASPDEKLFFLGQELEMYRGTFFRQTMFAEFEKLIHEKVEAGEALTGEAMTATYLDLLRAYHGAEEGVMEIDPTFAVEWAYIPHFFYDFYVFQYATSVAASTLFAERLLADEPGAQDAVVEMLKKGGSAYPHEMFKAAGVDLESPEPYQAVVARMNAIMDEMDAILGAE